MYLFIKRIILFFLLLILTLAIEQSLTSLYKPIAECRKIVEDEAKAQTVKVPMDTIKYCSVASKIIAVFDLSLAMVFTYLVTKDKSLKRNLTKNKKSLLPKK